MDRYGGVNKNRNRAMGNLTNGAYSGPSDFLKRNSVQPRNYAVDEDSDDDEVG
jgi:hypothetical protein